MNSFDIFEFDRTIRKESVSISLPQDHQHDEISEDKFYIVQNKKELHQAMNSLIAHRIRLHYVYHKLSSLSNSRTRLLPHQIEATHRVIHAYKPRFLLADEVGLGKTIEAGLILKELIFRKNYKNFLIVVPAPLQIQWQQELKNKFNEDFVIINSKNFRDILSKKIYKIITSIDFIKNPKYYETLLKIKWDLIIFDEAHRLRRDYNKITQAYSFAEKISKTTEGILLLSATPFRGKLEELYYLIKLIDPHLLGPEHSFFQEYIISSRQGENISHLRSKIEKILIRRRKTEVGGFTKRIVKTVKLDLSQEERLFYDEVTEYVKKEYNLSKEQQNRAIGFIMIVFQKLLDSSTKALVKALEKRRFLLETRIYQNHRKQIEEDWDWEEQIEYNENEDELVENLSYFDQNSYSLQNLRKEILTLSRLISIGKKIKFDTKVQKLKETIDFLKKNGYKKFVIFTQFRTTQEYLLEMLSSYRCNIFHGSLNQQQKEKEIQEFKEKGEILISTEAGGEGRNLQFANVLINYDLPWSPLKMEQRIGRIHRFGQKSDVLILNFSTRNTVAEKVLHILENKIRIFEESIGPSDILLGTIEEEINLPQLVMDFVSGKIHQKELEEKIESQIETIKKSYQLLSELISPKVMDFNFADYYKITNQEREVDNLHIEKLTNHYLSENPSSWKLEKFQTIKKPNKQKVHIYKIPSQEKLAIFDAEIALENEQFEFLAVGHPLVDEALNFYLNHPHKHAIIKLQAETLQKKGIFIVFLITYKNKDVVLRKELLSVVSSSKTKKGDHFSLQKKLELEDLFLKDFAKKSYSFHPITKSEKEKLIGISIRAKEWLQKTLQEENPTWIEEFKDLYKKEQYKIEISYGKKIRSLEEKKDIEKLRYKLNPTSERKAVLTRTENAILQTKLELQQKLNELNQSNYIQTQVEIFQIYWIL
ncbi:MAG: SNF2-related protein [Leptospiraceae bacterium]|nr:SNF2-related protein [Leptospiraceae bacterium]MDW7976032.1 SNF2-related protein [Leptospiraceae bacterium]